GTGLCLQAYREGPSPSPLRSCRKPPSERRRTPGQPAARQHSRRATSYLLPSQQQFHVERAFNRVGTIRRDLAKPQLSVYRDRLAHPVLNRVEAQASVPDFPRFRDDALGQDSAQPLASKLRANVQPLHLTDVPIEGMQSHASGRLTLCGREQQTTLRRSVVARQPRELPVEALKAEAKT